MNHTTTRRTTKSLAITLGMLIAIASALVGVIGITSVQSAAAITTKDPSILDLENSATNYLSEQKEKNNCSSGGSDTQCTNDATQSTRSREPETTGTLLVRKVCVTFETPGSPLPCSPGLPFSVEITGNNPQPSTFTLTPDSSQLVTLGPGSFTIVENIIFPTFGGGVTFSGACMQTAPGSTEATGTISAGQHLTCTITNTIIVK